MRINVRRSGGFAGTAEELGTIDTKTMSREASANITRQVADLARRAEGGDLPIGADMFRYELKVHNDDGTERTIAIPEEDPSELPASLRQLLAAL